MTVVTKRSPANRLAKVLYLPGGRTIESIEQEVEARLEALKQPCADALRTKVEEIAQRAAAMSRPPKAEELAQLHDLANVVLGLSGAAGLEHCGRAAISFCRLLDGWRSGRRWLAAPCEVHLQAIQLLCQPELDMDQQGRDTVVLGLEQVALRALA